jgi:large subunit ribosomal protein L15
LGRLRLIFIRYSSTTVYLPINLSDLNLFEEGTTVDEAILRGAGFANGKKLGIKVLGMGKLEKRLTVRASAFSKSAREAIEKLGGKAELITADVA